MNILYLFGLFGAAWGQIGVGYWGIPTFVGQWGLPISHAGISPLAQQADYGVPGVRGQSWGGPEFGLWQDINPLRNIIPVSIGKDGNVMDTPEIAQAKAEHFKAHQEAMKQGQMKLEKSKHVIDKPLSGFGAGKHMGMGEKYPFGLTFGKWNGPLAHIELTSDGKFLKDTPEVEKAKAAHFAALEAEKKSQMSVNDGSNMVENQTGEYKGEGEMEGQYKGEGQQEGQYQATMERRYL